MVTSITIPRTATPLPQPPFQPQQSFVQRLLEITIAIDPNPQTNQPATFTGTESNTVTLSGSRTSVRIENNGAPAGSSAEVLVFGLTQQLMFQLATLGPVFNSIARNLITISAGDAVNGLTPVFSGTIVGAYGDYNRAPDVPFHISAQSGTFGAVAPAVASSFPQQTDVATMMAGFASQLNVGFENNGITQKLPPSYYPGNTWTQVQKAARDANIKAELVDGGTKLAIWPIGGSRGDNAPIPLISADTGMDGYPSFTQQGLVVKMLFNPQVAFGGQIQVKSSLPPANATWVVQKLDLALDSLVPNGQWGATAYCYKVGFPAPLLSA